MISPTVTLSQNHPDLIVSDYDTVRITAAFSEAMSSTPTLNISSSLVTNTAMTASTTSVWYYDWNVPDGVDLSFAATATVSGTDLAGNGYSGTDSITDLGGSGSGGESDILKVSNGATVNATNIKSFTATGDTQNLGTATLTAISTGGTIDMSAASGSAVYTIISGAGTDYLKGNDGNDTFKIVASTEGNSDTIDGYGGADILQLSTGAHTFATDGNLCNFFPFRFVSFFFISLYFNSL